MMYLIKYQHCCYPRYRHGEGAGGAGGGYHLERMALLCRIFLDLRLHPLGLTFGLIAFVHFVQRPGMFRVVMVVPGFKTVARL